MLEYVWAARVKSVSSYLDDGCLLGCAAAVPHRLTSLCPLIRLLPSSPSSSPWLRPHLSAAAGTHTHSWSVSRAAARPRSVIAMVAKRASGHTHGAHHTLPESSQTLSIQHSPYYHTSCTPMGGVMWWCCVTPQHHPSALEQFPLWWHWHDSISIKPEKYRGMKGLSLNSQLLD